MTVPDNTAYFTKGIDDKIPAIKASEMSLVLAPASVAGKNLAMGIFREPATIPAISR
ncbi:MAG: hypothetical protein WCB17_03675 [Dehalococcoidales bacterium]